MHKFGTIFISQLFFLFLGFNVFWDHLKSADTLVKVCDIDSTCRGGQELLKLVKCTWWKQDIDITKQIPLKYFI
jgi:hypothetical protein